MTLEETAEKGGLLTRWVASNKQPGWREPNSQCVKSTKSFVSKLKVREIARSCGLPTSTVGDYLKRAEAAQLTWPLPADLTQEELQAKLLGASSSTPAAKELPDWVKVRQELRRKGVTLQLLWQEYRQTRPTGYGYSRYCELYQRWADTLDPVLRQVHVPGENLFVDGAGQTVPIQNSVDGSLVH